MLKFKEILKVKNRLLYLCMALLNQMILGLANKERALGKKFMTIALDFRGSGRSTQTSPAIVKYTTQLFADDLHAVLQKLGINKFIYVGHSIGANTGLVYVNKYPQQVTKLVLVSGDSYLVTSNCSILPDCSTSNCSACWAYPLAMFSQIAALEEQIAQLGFEDFCKNDN